MINSTFIKCINPQRIITRRGEPMTIACGHCEACLNRKSSLSTLKVQLEDKGSKYCKFITLTYSNDYVPLAKFVPDGFGLCMLVSTSHRYGVGEILATSYYDDADVSLLENKFNIEGFVPFLSKRDVQLFIKRLRKNISTFYKQTRTLPHSEQIKEEDFQIRYYAVGEYGPDHFRPHYHLLIWCESRLLHSSMGYLVHKSWPYGRIDCQTPVGTASNYVAGYLNSNCNLPRVLKTKSTAPFCLHSFYLGEKVLRLQKEEVYRQEPLEFIRRCEVIASKSRNFTLWSSLTSIYFPKCREYSFINEQERMFRYRLYALALDWTGETSCSKIAKVITDFFFCCRPFNDRITTPQHYRMLDYFQELLDIQHPFRYYQGTGYDVDFSMYDQFKLVDMKLKFYRKVYCDLRTSHRFIYLCCDNNPNKYKTMLDKIENFYKSIDSDNLRNFLITQEKMYNDYPFDDASFAYQYDEIASSYPIKYDEKGYKKSIQYKIMKSQAISQYTKAIKHKKQNDANQIFNF